MLLTPCIITTCKIHDTLCSLNTRNTNPTHGKSYGSTIGSTKCSNNFSMLFDLLNYSARDYIYHESKIKFDIVNNNYIER